MSRYRIYTRSGSGFDAAIQSVVYTLVTSTAFIWVPVVAIYVGWLAFQEWRDSKALPEANPVLICKSIDAVLRDKNLAPETRANVLRDRDIYCRGAKR